MPADITSASPVPPPITPPRNKSWLRYFFIALAILIVIDIVAVSYIVSVASKNNKTPVARSQNAAVISGRLDLDGYLPSQTTVSVQVRKPGDRSFTLATTINDPMDGSSWSWDGATDNTAYELQAVAILNNTTIAQSDIIGVTAPAANETFRLVSKAAPPKAETGVISGTMDLNGYIPANATITISAKKQGDTQGIPIVTNLRAADGAAWSWSHAVVGTSYELTATLYTGSISIGTSQSLVLNAPAVSEVLTINSTAAAPVSAGTISGSFNINGVVPAGATITLATRVSKTPNFNSVATGILPIDGGSWSWSAAQTGVSYDILAYLIVNGNVFTQSQLLVIPAPAQNEILTINISPPPPAPPANSISTTCTGKNSNNQWQISISYNNNQANPGAQQFILQIGTSTNDASVLNSTFAPSNPSGSQTYTTANLLNEKQTYYIKYAYATCSTCSTFSAFSTPFAFNCATQPTATPTSVPTGTPTPTATPIPTPTDTPTPTPTPKISQCNESCGGSGYTCVTGLDCTSIGSGIGASACRNPSCPTEPSCVCP